LEEELSEKPTPKKPSVVEIVCDSVWLAVTTLVLIGVYVVSLLANDTKYGVSELNRRDIRQILHSGTYAVTANC
jgi:hypothetical protein